MDYNLHDLLDREPIVLDNKSISVQLKDKVILVTGAAGSIGSEIVRQAVTFSPSKIIMLDQAETPLYLLDVEMQERKGGVEVHSVLCDIVNKEAMRQVFKTYNPDIVYHAAAYKHVPLLETNAMQALWVNILGTKNIADLAAEFNAGTFVLISTDKAVNPGNIMGASKFIAEKYIRALHEKLEKEGNGASRFITTRFGNVLGSNGSVVPIFASQIEKGGPVTVTHPDIMRYFMTIEEACQLVLEAGAMGNGAEIYLFNMGSEVKILDLACKMIIQAGFVPDQDIKIQFTGLRAGEKMNEQLYIEQSEILPTHNKKIMIVRDEKPDYLHVLEKIDGLLATNAEYNNKDMASAINNLVAFYNKK